MKPFELHEEDLARTAMDYVMFQRGVDAKELRERLGNTIAYRARITSNGVVQLEG